VNIPLSSPDITDLEVKAVEAVLRTPHLSLGPKLPEFEEKFARYIGAKHAVAVNSGTSGLHLCMRALDIHDGDEVITTPFSFIASANCIIFERAKPVFVDIKRGDYNLDETKIEEKITAKTKAILPVHVFGYPCNMGKISNIAKKYNLKVVEDSCEAIGAEIGGKKAGTFGDCSVFAFYPNKQMTTGEGGMLVTNDKTIADLAKSMRNQGRDAGMGWLGHNRLGYNYRLSDINCALGIAQLDRINEMLDKRQKVAEMYLQELGTIDEIKLPPAAKQHVRRSWFVFVAELAEKFTIKQRDTIIKTLREKGIGCNIYFPPIHLQPFYAKEYGYKRGDFLVTETISDRTIALPFFNNLTLNDIRLVAKELKNSIKKAVARG
jgi:perosamine synthetase